MFRGLCLSKGRVMTLLFHLILKVNKNSPIKFWVKGNSNLKHLLHLGGLSVTRTFTVIWKDI